LSDYKCWNSCESQNEWKGFEAGWHDAKMIVTVQVIPLITTIECRSNYSLYLDKNFKYVFEMWVMWSFSYVITTNSWTPECKKPLSVSSVSFKNENGHKFNHI